MENQDRTRRNPGFPGRVCAQPRSARTQVSPKPWDWEKFTQAQGHVRLERELGELRALVTDFSTTPSALTARVRTLERAIEVLHANLAIARQYLATLFH